MKAKTSRRSLEAQIALSVDHEYYVIKFSFGYESVGVMNLSDELSARLGVKPDHELISVSDTVSAVVGARGKLVDIVLLSNPREWHIGPLSPPFVDSQGDVYVTFEEDGERPKFVTRWDPVVGHLEVAAVDESSGNWYALADRVLISIHPDDSVHGFRFLGLTTDPRDQWKSLMSGEDFN